jgi:lipid A ethanolaminephosphotransferase
MRPSPFTTRRPPGPCAATVRTRPRPTALALCWGVALFLASLGNLALWRRLLEIAPPDSTANLLFLFSVGALAAAIPGLVFAVLASPYLLKPLLIAALLVSAPCAYFMSAYGVVIDASMIQNAVQTDAGEVGDLLGWGLALHLLLLGVLPAVGVALWPLRFGSLRQEIRNRGALAGAVLALCSALVGAQFKQFALVGRQHKEVRQLFNPISPLYAALRHLSRERGTPRLVRIGEDARRPAAVLARPRRSLVVLVVGETARAVNFSLNGYARQTNPRLAHYPVVSFTHVRSCGTATAVSLPCMFSAAGRAGYDKHKLRRQEGLLDVLQRAGVAVLWRDNNSGCKGTCDRVPTQSWKELRTPEACPRGECFDEVLLSGLQGFIDSLSRDALVVLHQKGSHGPAYHRRSPAAFKRFRPECARPELQRCPRASLLNAYDNTILYTDYVLSRVIDLLQANAARLDTAMLYVSDHGESLGERGLYLHGLPWLLAPRVQKHVPLLLWLSEPFARGAGIDVACLRARRAEPLSHDHLFHSILGLFQVQTGVYSPALDLVAACRTSPPAPPRAELGGGATRW